MSSVLNPRLVSLLESLVEVVLSPFVVGPLWLGASKYPQTVQHGLTEAISRLPVERLRSMAVTTDCMGTLVYVLRILFFVGLARSINRMLNVMASNAWRLRRSSGWEWPKELAVVTGGSSGIGADIVRGLVKHRVRVAVFDIQALPKPLEALPGVKFYKCDLTSAESVAAAADAVRRDYGHPSILINNAGITDPMPILKMPESFLKKIFSVNCMSLWTTTQQFLPRMIQVNKGHIVTVASLASFTGLPAGADYAATKAGALAFHESLTCELQHFYKAPNVMTTVVHPNFVRTPLIANLAGDLEAAGVNLLTSEGVAKSIVSQVISRRGGQLILPSALTTATMLRGLPTWIQELIRGTMGRNAAAANIGG